MAVVMGVIGAVVGVAGIVAGGIQQKNANDAQKEQAKMNEDFQKKTEDAETERMVYQAKNSVNNVMRSIRF